MIMNKIISENQYRLKLHDVSTFHYKKHVESWFHIVIIGF